MQMVAEAMRLSHSKVTRHDFCPRAYRYYYVEGWRPIAKRPSLLFGGAIDRALSALFQQDADPLAVFSGAWEALRGAPVAWGKRHTWEALRDIGGALLERFMKEERPRFSEVRPECVQRHLSAELAGVTFIGYPDLYARVDGLRTLVDFKTAQASYDPEEVRLNEQLTAYWWLLEANHLPVDRVAFCVLLKLKEPRIEWHFATRRPEEVAEYRDKLALVASDIVRGRFPKKTSSCGQWGGCDYRPLCLGDEAAIPKDLVLTEEITDEEVIV
ncbi:MAG: PD-(D/E)XK nuclease family protein [Nitrospirota bacterium]